MYLVDVETMLIAMELVENRQTMYGMWYLNLGSRHNELEVQKATQTCQHRCLFMLPGHRVGGFS